jgi:hypothetical protein
MLIALTSASKNVSHLADTYSKAAESIASLAESNDAGSSIGGSLNSSMLKIYQH